MAETAGGIYYPTKDDPVDTQHDFPKMAESVEDRFEGIKGDATLTDDGTLTIADAVVTSRKARLIAGTIYGTEASQLITLAGYVDLTGSKLEITPAVASLLKVTAVFDFEAVKTAENQGLLYQLVGTLNVDGVDKAPLAAFMGQLGPPGAGIFGRARGTVAQSWTIPLSAALHTLKLRAKVEATQANVQYIAHGPNTSLSYTLLAS